MKYFTMLMGLVLFLGTTGVSMAQSKTVPTKISTHPLSHGINLRLRADMTKIQKDIKSGKLTKTVAQTVRGQLKSIRVQELQFLKANGTNELTTTQAAQLNQSLEQAETSL